MSNLRPPSDDQIQDLISKLQLLLHELHTIQGSNKESEASRVLEDTCNCIKRLHREVDELSERLFQLLPTADTSDQAALIRSLLMQSTST